MLIHMEWFFLALMAPIVWALGNHIDAFLVKSFIRDGISDDSHSVGSLIIVSCLVGILLLPICALIEPDVFSVVSNTRWVLMLVGILEGLSILCYLYVIVEEDIASVAAWFNLVPVFNLVLGFLILGEGVTKMQVIGFIIIISGLCILSVKRTEIGLIMKKRVVILMLLASLGYSLMTILFKLSADVSSFWESSFWQYIGLSILAVSLFAFVPVYRKSFLRIFKSRGVKFYGINLVNEFLYIAGTMVSNYASLLAPVALVSLVGSFQPLIVLIFGFVLVLFFGKKKAEKVPLSDRWLQIVGILLTIAGLPFIL